MAKWKNHNRAREAGLTLLGVLVSVLIFASVTLAMMNLVGRTMREVGRSREELLATNLAREGLELAQHVRDTNWLNAVASQPWTGNTTPSSPPLCVGSEALHSIIIDRRVAGGANIVRIQDFTGGSNADQLYLQADNSYEHTPIPGQIPRFTRRLDIDCTNSTTPDNEHIIVNSIVGWTSRGQTHNISLSTHLYNWRQ